jgi:uncharacterized phage-associated protein
MKNGQSHKRSVVKTMASDKPTVNFGAPSSAKIAPSGRTGSSSPAISITAGLPTPQDVAAFLIRIAALEDEPDFFTHLRLQKLMYYVQAWSLANRGHPAFMGRIEAWAHGPVVRELYSTLSVYGNQPIPGDALPNQSPLTKDDKRFVASVWEAYKGFTAFALRSMTHNESPWIDARGSAGPADICTTEITHDSMMRYFCKV